MLNISKNKKKTVSTYDIQQFLQLNVTLIWSR